jgi:PAS domain S-box-containing protein
MLAGFTVDITERKRAEEALRESEAVYRQAIEVAGAVPYRQTYISGTVGVRYTFIGEGIREITGYGPEEFDTELWDSIALERVLLEDLAEYPFEDAIQRVRLGNNPIWKCEHRIRARDGQIHWVFEAAVELRDEHGVSHGSIGLYQDITARKQAEEALQESENRLRFALEGANDGLWDVQMATGAVYLSPRACEILGYGPDEMDEVARVWSLLVHPDDLLLTNERLQAHLEGRAAIFEVEQRLKMKSGEWKWVLARGKVAEYDPQGRAVRMTGTHTDITARKKAEEALRESEERFRTLYDNATIGLYRTTPAGRILMLNPAGVRMLGYTSFDEIVQRDLEDPKYYVGSTRKDFREKLEREGTIFNLERKMLKKDGSVIIVRESAKVTRNENGESLYYEGSFEDITERKQAEIEREKLIAELSAKNAELERFTYTVSHDLKSPLVTIRGFLGYMAEDALSGNIPRMENDIQRIKNATDKMQDLLHDLLELSRIGRIMNPSETIKFDDLLHDALDIVYGQLEAGHITVLTQSNLPAVHGDRQRLTEVLQNLLDNAIKYMGDQPDPRIEIGEHGEETGKPIFFIKDNGIGIAPEYHERIFGLFNKLDAKSEGTGVGLALVKRIVEVYGGRIWVESEPGKGSTFYFSLPKG